MRFILRNSDLHTNRLETKQKAGWPKGLSWASPARAMDHLSYLFASEYINSNDGHKSALKLGTAVVAWKTRFNGNSKNGF